MQLHEYGTVQFVVKWMIENKAGNDLDVSDVYLIEKIIDACHGDLRKHCMSKGVANNVINPTCKHKWDDGWVCSKCGVRKADWIEADIKTTKRGKTMSIETHADKKRNEAKDHIADAFRCLMSAADAKENWSVEYAENLEDAILLLHKVSKML